MKNKKTVLSFSPTRAPLFYQEQAGSWFPRVKVLDSSVLSRYEDKTEGALSCDAYYA